MNYSTEYILCAAIYLNDGKVHSEQPENISTGFVITGQRHNHCYATLQAISKHSAQLKHLQNIWISNTPKQHHHGFITSHNRYLNRAEAFSVAVQAGQIPTTPDETPCLISEMLY